MRQAEKVALGVLVFVLALVLINAIDNIWLLIVLFVLALFYAIGGYWLFRAEKIPNAIPIIAGVAFGAALLTLPTGFRVQIDLYKGLTLAAPNALLFLFLLFYTYPLTQKNWLGDNLNPMLFRSGVLLALTAIIATSPINTWAHRQILRPLNQQNESLLHNFNMFDYADMAKEELDAGRCEKAISAANAARKEGELWLEWQEGDSLEELRSISGVLDLQYEAYLCKGKAAWQNNNYRQALSNYQYVDKVLDNLITIDSSNIGDKVWLWERMAKCYAELYEYEASDSLYALAIKLYVKQGWEHNEDLAELIVGLGSNLIAQGATDQYYQAMQPFINRFENIQKEKGNSKGVMVLYLNMVQNSLRLKNLEHAKLYLDKGSDIVGGEESLDYYKLQHYKGYLAQLEDNYYEAIKHFEEAKQGYMKVEPSTSLNHVSIRQALFSTYFALADFKTAASYLNEALSMSEKIAGKNSLNYYQVLKDAVLLDEQLGNYETAKEKLEQVHRVYEKIWGKNNKVLEVMVHLASVESELDNQVQARNYLRSIEQVISEYPDYINNIDVETMLRLANVRLELQDYKAAESIYKSLIEGKDEKLMQIQKAKVNTGIAIIDIERGNYKEAYRLLKQAMIAAKNVFGESHPIIATLYYNKSSLLFHQKDLTAAHKEIEKTIVITKAYYAPQHPNHADNDVMLGDIYLGSGKIEEAEEKYRGADKIYKMKYKAEHRKRRNVKERIDLLRNKQKSQHVV